mmetsp:Transcript_26480/g.40622  ORF Transcript_26480/g.40622 Transcript_26480/m.40622 type:complete len:522 (+) Transcript_26480:95-1660(+)
MTGIQQQSQNKNGKSEPKIMKRIYIGNLRPKADLKEELYVLLGQSGIAVDKESIQVLKSNNNNKCSAFVPCKDIQHAISCLHGNQYDGRRLVVQREKKNSNNNRRSNNNKGTKSSSFGASGWAKPTTPAIPQNKKNQQEQQQERTTKGSGSNENDSGFESHTNNNNWDDVSDMIGDAVSNEILAARDNPSSGGDELNAVIASTAAVTLLASLNAFGGESSPIVSVAADTEESTKDTPDKDAKAPFSGGDFRSMCQKPLSALLADYGEQDTEWKKVIVPTTAPDESKPSVTQQQEQKQHVSHSMLAPEGKAPIHVELVSFGYVHGIPPEIRSGGWSHAYPVLPTDTRHLPEVPHYLARQDGKSAMVKRALLYASDASNSNGSDGDDNDDKNYNKNNDEKGQEETTNRLKICANRMASQVADALEQAIVDGGYGHASPLRMAVHVGSDNGRHRCVVVCEMAAVALRSILRKNLENKITQPISVGTRHRDIDRNRYQKDKDDDKNYTNSANTARSKQKELESDW